MKKNKILIVEDEGIIAEQIAQILIRNDYKVVGKINSAETALESIKKNKPDAVFMDIVVKGNMNGIQAAEKIYKNYDIPVIFVTSYSDEKTVLNAIGANPFGFIIKPFDENELLINLKIALNKHYNEIHKLKDQYKQVLSKYDQIVDNCSLLNKQLENSIQKNLVGKSDATKNVLQLAMQAAQNDNTNVIITGESGTGKEIIARIIHYASSRKNHNFCVVNSSAIPDSLLESQFFGHAKGAFTGATRDKKGYLEMADKGTLFLDEIADMRPGLQAKLLRVIEEKKVTRIGNNKSINVDFRIISATNRDLDEMIDKNLFRLDLLFRLNTLKIHIPPLRERKSDIETLLTYYIHKISNELKVERPELTVSALRALENYDFPGNVRELKNMVESALISSNNKILLPEDFHFSDYYSKPSTKETTDFDLIKNEIGLIKKALDKTKYNQTKAAELLNISRDALKRRLKKYNIKIKKQI